MGFNNRLDQLFPFKFNFEIHPFRLTNERSTNETQRY